ncbi:unnamed protein product [Brassicogethes aeneus]|uniref:Uncharacterized protein n=1 Tax=Brassicogethes aeneus TaxID=1431903 RepID=A0A9P0B4C1_BRAAE|nr:unnamed protein product [Brassicogethes aeneus]
MVYWRDFKKNTSIQGLMYCFYRGRSNLEWLFWIFAFLVCIMALLVMFINMIQLYQVQPIHNVVNKNNYPVNAIPAPALTICLKPSFEMNFDICSWYYKQESEYTKLDYLKKYILQMMNRVENDDEINVDYVDINEFILFTRLGSANLINLIKCTMDLGNQPCFKSWQTILTPLGMCISYNMVALEDLYRENVTIPNLGLDVYPHRILGAGRKASMAIDVKDVTKSKRKKTKKKKSDIRFGCMPDKSSGMYLVVHNPSDIPDFTKPLSAQFGWLSEIGYTPTLTDITDSIKGDSPKNRGCYMHGEKYLRLVYQILKIVYVLHLYLLAKVWKNLTR